MVASRESQYWHDFSGGLNLTEQTQTLLPSETPDCLNVDFGLRGGFMLRGGFHTVAENVLLNGATIIGVAGLTSPKVLLQSTAGDLLSFDGSSLTDTTFQVSDSTDRVRSASFASKSYFVNGRLSGNLVSRSWDGSTLVTLTNAWNNDYLLPTTGNMPLARHVAEHKGFLYVADTVEGPVRYPARVRFSHEQHPESWAEADYFEVGDPSANDPVTGLLPFGDMLLIFKRASVWALYGYNRDTFTLERVTNGSGTCTCGPVAVNAGVAYWFSTDGQLMAFNGRGVTVLSQPLAYWSDLGRIRHGGSHRLMWSDGRLYLSLEAGPGEAVSRWLFVWSPAVGAFTRYDPQVTDMVHWSRFGADGDPLFLFDGLPYLFRYDRAYENDLYGSTVTRIDGYFRTAWMTADETATRKRWKRPRVTAAASESATLRVDVFLDFDDRDPKRFHEFEIATPETAEWGALVWGDDTWFAAADDYYEFARLGSSGSGYSVAYQFSSDNNLGRWWVDSLTVPFRRKRIK